MNVSIAPSLVAMSMVCSIIGAPSGCVAAAFDKNFTSAEPRATQPTRRLPASYSIADDARWKILHYGDCGATWPRVWDWNWTWKTGEGIAIGAGGAILTRVILAVAVAAGITAAGGAAVTVRGRGSARRGWRSSRRARRYRQW